MTESLTAAARAAGGATPDWAAAFDRQCADYTAKIALRPTDAAGSAAGMELVELRE